MCKQIHSLQYAENISIDMITKCFKEIGSPDQLFLLQEMSVESDQKNTFISSKNKC
jgi:hypothetical protein